MNIPIEVDIKGLMQIYAESSEENKKRLEQLYPILKKSIHIKEHTSLSIIPLETSQVIGSKDKVLLCFGEEGRRGFQTVEMLVCTAWAKMFRTDLGLLADAKPDIVKKLKPQIEKALAEK